MIHAQDQSVRDRIKAGMGVSVCGVSVCGVSVCAVSVCGVSVCGCFCPDCLRRREPDGEGGVCRGSDRGVKTAV